jgi:hypothetical protein
VTVHLIYREKYILGDGKFEIQGLFAFLVTVFLKYKDWYILSDGIFEAQGLVDSA